MGKKLKISTRLGAIIIINRDTQVLCKIDEIVLIKSENDYVRVYSPDTSCLILGTLKRICQELPDYFIISHRSYIVNIKKIKEIKAITKKRYLAIMMNNIEVPLTNSALNKINAFFI